MSFVRETPSRLVAALLTPRGRGAVATIAFRGDATPIDAVQLFRAANGHRVVDQPLARAVFGHWGSEEVVLCRLSPDKFEVHCHGGDAAAARILSQLEAIGARTIGWHEFVEQTQGRFAADVAAALAAAATPRTAAIISVQAEGSLRQSLQRLAGADPDRDRDEILQEIDALLRWSEFGRHLTRPWRVVLYGAPNVGKSSLINALVGFERAIVFDRPGTTRDVVTAETAIAGWPVRLSDTAGLRSNADKLEAQGIARARSELAEADLRILVLDRSVPPDENPTERSPDLVVANKIDQPDAWGDRLGADCLLVSAKTGASIRELMAQIVARLVPATPAANEPVPISARQIEAIERLRDAVTSRDGDGFRHALRDILR